MSKVYLTWKYIKNNIIIDKQKQQIDIWIFSVHVDFLRNVYYSLTSFKIRMYQYRCLGLVSTHFPKLKDSTKMLRSHQKFVDFLNYLTWMNITADLRFFRQI